MLPVVETIFGKLDTTKIRVTEGDLEKGDWIFNGQGMVFSSKEKDAVNSHIVIPLTGKFRVIPKKAEEFGVLRQFGSDMSPLMGAIAGVTVMNGLFGVMTGFAAGSMLGRNVATFTCLLDDGRSFDGVADYRIFRRLQEIAHL